jgi:hypothetical protein
MSFQSDLKLGEEYQQKYVSMIDYDSYEMATGNFKAYDIKVVKHPFTKTYEVKADRMTAKTGNVVIEYECSGKPSGITSTEADVWIYFIVGTNEYIEIETPVLRQLIADNKWTKKIRGGNGYRAAMYLFPRSEFEEFIKTY